MPDIAPPEPAGWLRRYRVELLWVAFALANYAAMIVSPSWETIPFHFVWISLTLLYGFRVWPVRATLLGLACVMAATGASIGFDAFRGIQLWGELTEVPLMAAMFLAMVWHARRRVDAQHIAEQEANERRSMLARQERFIHDASHELRTPVTIARGHLELLRGQLGETDEIEVALDELSRIDAITGRLLLLATADQPDFVQPAEIELEPLLEDVFMRWSDVAPRLWRLGALAPGWLRVDAGRLRVALDALLENAVKYTEPSAVIELRARRDGPTGVSIEVQDEGRGVPPQALARIFERFARADPARTRSAGGVGLGLAIVDAIVKAHEGSCTVRSTARGSIFAVHLPNFAATDSELAPAAAAGRSSAGAPRSRIGRPSLRRVRVLSSFSRFSELRVSRCGKAYSNPGKGAPMTPVLVLNAVLAIVVVGALLRLLSWAIISSRRDQLLVKPNVRQRARHPYARPHVSHPHWPRGSRPQQGARTPVTD